MSKNDGGQAFPLHEITYGKEQIGTHIVALTLRDYFAGQALVGLMASPLLSPEVYKDMPIEECSEFFAKVCYKTADTMLAERNKDEG